MSTQFHQLAAKMDEAIVAVAARVDALKDIDVKFSQLRVDMDSAVIKGMEKFAYREHHLEVRVLSELMFYVMKELQRNIEVAEKLSQQFFKDTSAEAS
ncbi:hypothetical protein [Cohnella sp. AR92]|uniref:hypothetical protein n=1 Tax=Cohnella sp. AR92 TaxID=648716 RepID=UPI000F8C957A|nr:hypothetical protein [Cohnella sp. AR92]RUS47671.1 hypothetical protein ELR57_07760 [Cohnella sp. AR92]